MTIPKLGLPFSSLDRILVQHNIPPQCWNTPFKAVYGRDPPSIIKYTVNKKDPPNVQEQLLQRDHTLSQLKFNLTRAQ